MKQTKKKIVWLVAFLAVGSIPVFGKPFAVGPYLGQTPPGSTPQVFAPGLICDTGHTQWEANGTFSADGNTFCFNRRSGIFITENTEQGWTTPELIKVFQRIRIRPGWAVCLRMPIVFSLREPCRNRCPNAIYIAAFERQVDGPNHSNLDRHLALRPPNLPALWQRITVSTSIVEIPRRNVFGLPLMRTIHGPGLSISLWRGQLKRVLIRDCPG